MPEHRFGSAARRCGDRQHGGGGRCCSATLQQGAPGEGSGGAGCETTVFSATGSDHIRCPVDTQIGPPDVTVNIEEQLRCGVVGGSR